MTVADLDLESLGQIAGTIWLLAVSLLALVLLLTLLLPILLWRICWWTRAGCRETARLNEKVEHLLTWPIGVRREDLAPKEGAGEETFSFQRLAGQDDGEVPAGGYRSRGRTPARIPRAGGNGMASLPVLRHAPGARPRIGGIASPLPGLSFAAARTVSDFRPAGFIRVAPPVSNLLRCLPGHTPAIKAVLR